MAATRFHLHDDEDKGKLVPRANVPKGRQSQRKENSRPHFYPPLAVYPVVIPKVLKSP